MPFHVRRGTRVRPVSRAEGNNRIRGLKCYSEVHERILEGWPLTELARFIQEIKKEATEISQQSLVIQLGEFRSSLPPAELIKKALPATHGRAAAKVEEGIDELHEMEKLYRLQMGRIGIDVDNEKAIKKLLPTTGQEVRIAREILSNYADLKMDLGLSKRHLGQMDVDARLMHDVAVRYNKPEVQAVVNDAQARKKVLSLVERLMSRPTVVLGGEGVQAETSLPPTSEAVVIDVPAEDAEITDPEALLSDEPPADFDPLNDPIVPPDDEEEGK